MGRREHGDLTEGLEGKRSLAEMSRERGRGQNMQGIHSRVRAVLSFKRNGVPMKGFKQWAERSNLCFEKEPTLSNRLGEGKYKVMDI